MLIRNKIINYISTVILGREVRFKKVRPEVFIQIRRNELVRQIANIETPDDLEKFDEDYQHFYNTYFDVPGFLRIAQDIKRHRRDQMVSVIFKLSKVQ